MDIFGDLTLQLQNVIRKLETVIQNEMFLRAISQFYFKSITLEISNLAYCLEILAKVGWNSHKYVVQNLRI